MRTVAGTDENDVKSLLAVSSTDGESIVVLWADPVTHALLVKLSGGSLGAIINATNSGDNQNYTLAKSATTSEYYVIMNNGSYTTDDSAFPFSVSGTTLTFTSPLPTELANTQIRLVCV